MKKFWTGMYWVTLAASTLAFLLLELALAAHDAVEAKKVAA